MDKFAERVLKVVDPELSDIIRMFLDSEPSLEPLKREIQNLRRRADETKREVRQLEANSIAPDLSNDPPFQEGDVTNEEINEAIRNLTSQPTLPSPSVELGANDSDSESVNHGVSLLSGNSLVKINLDIDPDELTLLKVMERNSAKSFGDGYTSNDRFNERIKAALQSNFRSDTKRRLKKLAKSQDEMKTLIPDVVRNGLDSSYNDLVNGKAGDWKGLREMGNDLTKTSNRIQLFLDKWDTKGQRTPFDDLKELLATAITCCSQVRALSETSLDIIETVRDQAIHDHDIVIERMQDGFKGVSSSLEGTEDRIQSSIDTAQSSIENHVDGRVDAAEDRLHTGIDATSKVIQDQIQKVHELTSSTSTVLRDGLDSASNNHTQLMQQIDKSNKDIGDRITDTRHKVTEAVTNLGSALSGNINSISDKANYIGNLVSQVIEGCDQVKSVLDIVLPIIEGLDPGAQKGADLSVRTMLTAMHSDLDAIRGLL